MEKYSFIAKKIHYILANIGTEWWKCRWPGKTRTSQGDRSSLVPADAGHEKYPPMAKVDYLHFLICKIKWCHSIQWRHGIDLEAQGGWVIVEAAGARRHPALPAFIFQELQLFERAMPRVRWGIRRGTWPSMIRRDFWNLKEEERPCIPWIVRTSSLWTHSILGKWPASHWEGWRVQ